MLGIPIRVHLHRLEIYICQVLCCVLCCLCVTCEDILGTLSKVLLQVSQQYPGLRLWRLYQFQFLGSGVNVSVSSASSD